MIKELQFGDNGWGKEMIGMAEQIAQLRRQLHDNLSKERQLMQELDAAFIRADAEIHAEIENLKDRHVQRRREVFRSLVELSNVIGTLPALGPWGHLGQPNPASMEHYPAPPGAPVAKHDPYNVETIAEYTRNMRARR